jgi:cyclase
MLKPALKEIGAGVYAWIGVNGDSNAGAVMLPGGLLAVDAQQTKPLGQNFREAIEAQSGRPVTQLIDTHFHLDHTAGNAAFADVPIVAHDRTLQLIREYIGPAKDNRWLVSDPEDKFRLFFGSNARELVPPGDPLEEWFMKRLNTPENGAIDLLGPSETFSDDMAFERPEGTLQVRYLGPAHCDGDLVLHLPRQRILFLGDLLFVGRFPWLGDCDLDKWIALLKRVLLFDVQTVVPGHGEVCSLKEVAAFYDLLASLREAVQQAVRSNLSEEAAVDEVELPAYAALPRYREWRPANVRSAYRYLKNT